MCTRDVLDGIGFLDGRGALEVGKRLELKVKRGGLRDPLTITIVTEAEDSLHQR
jgi:hypothetical protein